MKQLSRLISKLYKKTKSQDRTHLAVDRKNVMR